MVNYPEQWREFQNIKNIPDIWLNWGLQEDPEKIAAEERKAEELKAEEEGKEWEPKEELEREL